MTQSGPLMSIDTAAAAFRKKQPLIDAMMEERNVRRMEDLANMSPQDTKRLGKALSRIKVSNPLHGSTQINHLSLFVKSGEVKMSELVM